MRSIPVWIVLFIMLVIIFAPLISIWAINTLFPAADVPYTFWTWLAALVLFSGGVRYNAR